MFQNLTRREFIKTAALSFLAVNTVGLLPDSKVFAASDCVVKTRYGTFNGFVDEKGVRAWLGIPFAQQPVGKLRWRAPEPLSPSNKTFDAKKFGASPIQAAIKVDNPVEDDDETPQGEDCLTLNIFTRGTGKNKPVMVFIYGGAFVSGYSSEDLYSGPNFVAAQDVVIVTLNYRLGVLGFMNFGAIDSSFEDSGYLGIKDQVAALKWVKENIELFGGDPDNMTVFGESAGSISTMLLTVIPAAKGLFHKVIPQSGHVDFYNEPDISAQFAETYLTFTGAKKVSDLMKKSGFELKYLYEKLINSHGGSNIAEFLPTCDGKFIPRDPFKALKDGAARGVKFLTGTTADEWRAFLLGGENFFEVFRKEPTKISPVLRRYKAQKPEEVYRKWLNGRPDTDDAFADFVTQTDWRVGQELSSEYQSKFDDVYFYLFTEPAPIENLGACHALDLPYTFDIPFEDFAPNPNLVKAIQASWAAFAATGNPDNEFIPHWKKYSAADRQTMELNSKGCVCHKDLNTQNLNALRYLYER
ncbi:MAG: carboxylesterase/lipase family protein [Selenomonadaceae bacterium]|nr:carboxylesterase/lipase family protein [Selenomonadaceae bacterium]